MKPHSIDVTNSVISPHHGNDTGSSYWAFLKKYFGKFFKWLRKDSNWKWVIVTLSLSGIIHILTVFSMPYFAPQSGWSRLQNFPLHQMQVIENALDTAHSIPMLAPNIKYAVCRFDVRSGPVSIVSDVPSDLFSIAAYDRLGQNFYVLFGSNLQRSKLNVILVQSSDLEDMQALAAESSEDVILVEATDSQGVVLLRAPISGRVYVQSTLETLQQATCARKQK
ncbi:MAG: hypothetical protein AAF228_04950 [Pseudomonadota bacterium]